MEGKEPRRIRRILVVGGPCGRPIRYPNSKVKRGWSYMRVKWRFEKGEPLPEYIPCGNDWYQLREEAGTLYYMHRGARGPEPPPPPPPKVLSPMIVQAIGAQRYWLAQLDKRGL